MTEPIRILLADDQHLVRGAMAALLSLESDIAVVAEVGRGDEVVARATETRPDVALIDVEMPGADGITATRELRTALSTCRVLVVTTFGRPGYVRRGRVGSWSRTPRRPSLPTPSGGYIRACGSSIPRSPSSHWRPATVL